MIKKKWQALTLYLTSQLPQWLVRLSQKSDVFLKLITYLVGLRFRRRKLAGTSSKDRMLPVLIEVLAGFSQIDGSVDEDEVDSSLGYLRYDYSGATYSDMRKHYLYSLNQPLDLKQRAQVLSLELNEEQKILLCIQLYLLIIRDDIKTKPMADFYEFMNTLGISDQAVNIVYQLSVENYKDEDLNNKHFPLEILTIGNANPSDVILKSLSNKCQVMAFRFQNLILLKNTGEVSILVRSKRQPHGEFSRLYLGEKLIMEDLSLDYNDLLSYFKSKQQVPSSQLFVTLNEAGNAEISPTRHRGATLKITFGLSVVIHPLKSSDASVNGIPLKVGEVIEASVEDRINTKVGIEISLLELKKRAQDFGGQFKLEGSRNVYLVSNNPKLLNEGDILLSADNEGELLLRIECHYAQSRGHLEVLKSPRPIYLGDLLVRERASLMDGDIITLAEGQFLRCQFQDRIIEEERNFIRVLEVKDLQHRFDGKDTALDSIGFQVRRGEMVCVMGPSGCGKSTLLRCLAGLIQPKYGEISMNGFVLSKYLDRLTPYIAFSPQEDTFEPLLTVAENIDSAAIIRAPHLRSSHRKKRVEAKLSELGLAEIKKRLAGTVQQKILSGGERKRLNAGLDTIGIADVYLFDEPTSGLSSKDSEHTLELIRNLAENKIVIASIHQPSSRLLKMFDKALLLDRGGKMAFYGEPKQMLEYFWQAYQDETGLEPVGDRSNLTPDFVFDVLETPLYDISGDMIQERSSDGHWITARRFPPNFWRDRFQSHTLLSSVVQSGEDAGKSMISTISELNQSQVSSQRPRMLPTLPKLGLSEEWLLFYTHLRRSFLSKMRNRTNLITTLLEAPALALLIAFVLRFSEEKHYTFASAYHIPTYLFMALVVAMFLGLTNSADEVMRDRPTLNRERHHNLRIGYYLFSKWLSLSLFAVLQCVIFIWIGNTLLNIQGMFLEYLWWMVGTAALGNAIGLLISTLVHEQRTALNLIPLMLIPQIILGGALIKYEEMNRNLDLLYTLEQLVKVEGDSVDPPPTLSQLRVPFVCEFMPLRWTYEGIILSQAYHNPLTHTVNVIEARKKELMSVKFDEMKPEQLKELNLIKQALALAPGMTAERHRQIIVWLRQICNAVKEGQLTEGILKPIQDAEGSFNSDEIYINRKVLDLVTKAEIEEMDRLRKDDHHVFFGREHSFFKMKVSTMGLNSAVVIIWILLTYCGVGWILRLQLNKIIR